MASASIADLLVIIPAYNEEASLPQVLTRLAEVVPEADVVVIDDGSSDREDVEWLIAQFMRQAIPATMGGAGSYETQGPAGAFLHLDTRGTPAAWQR